MKEIDVRSVLIGFLAACCLGLLAWQIGPGATGANAAQPVHLNHHERNHTLLPLLHRRCR
jgi:hypothetical protein